MLIEKNEIDGFYILNDNQLLYILYGPNESTYDTYEYFIKDNKIYLITLDDNYSFILTDDCLIDNKNNMYKLMSVDTYHEILNKITDIIALKNKIKEYKEC